MNDTHRVHVSEIRLTDFRNYSSLALPLDSRHVVLTGENGAGKTNLLEAVSLLSPGRGLRRATYAEMCRAHAADGFTVFARANGMEGEVAIGTGAGGDNGSRLVRINGTRTSSADEMLDHLRIVWLTPAMDGLFTGPKNDRRRFLDRQVLAIDPAHGRRTLDYDRAMRSRNRLLSEGRFDPSWLEGIEQQMAELGVAIAMARREMVTLMISLIDSGQLASPFPRAALTLDDFLEDLTGSAAADLEESFAWNLARSRYRDAAAGRTLEGPHRSDLLVRHAGKDMEAARCSTGEQKALLIGLVLAHARLTAQTCGFAPLMLLDEIAAHLDEGRRAALFDLVEDLGGQAFMTGTDRDMFAALGDRARHFKVSDGTVRETTG